MGFLGLDDTSSPTAVQDGRATDLQNVNFTLTYGLTKREGDDVVGDILDKAGADFAPVTGLYYTEFSSGTEYTVAYCDTRFYKYNATTDVWDLTGTAGITTGGNYQWVFTTALDNIISTNDYDIPKVYDGASFKNASFTGLTTAVTKAKCVAWFKNYLIWGNTYEGAEKSTRIRWANVGTIDAYSDEDYIDIATLGGQEIEAVGILYDNLYILMTNAIYKLTLVGGDEIFVVTQVDDKVGCISKNSVQHINLSGGQKGMMFLSRDKTVNFFNGVTITEISTLISNTMAGLTASRLPYAVSAYDGSNYYLSVTDTETYNDLLLVFNTGIGEWTKYKDINANAIAVVLDADGEQQVYFGNNKNFVYQLYDNALASDVQGVSGTVDSIGYLTTKTASGLQVIYDSSAAFIATGATVKIISGTGEGEEKVIVALANDVATGLVATGAASGFVVDSAFTDTPDTTSVYSIGIIDAHYQTKWFDMGQAARRKHLLDLYIWAEEESGTDIAISYASDFGSTITTETVDLTGTGGVWGTAIWGVSKWGGQDAIFSSIPLKASGRYSRFKFSNDDADETFKLYGYSILNEPLDLK